MTMVEHDKNILKGVVKSSIDEAFFQLLCKEHRDLLADLKRNKLLAKFCDEYGKIMVAFQKSHENEKKLMIKCRELRADIFSNAVRLEHVKKISSEDSSNIAALKKELELAWKQVAAATDKENKARQRIKLLKEEIAILGNIIEKGDTGEVAVDAISEVTKNLEKLVKEKSEQAIENAKLRAEIEAAKEQISALQDDVLLAQQKITELGRDIQARAGDAQRELRKKERMELEMNEVRDEVEMKQTEIKTINNIIEQLRNDLKTRQEEDRLLKISLEQTNRQLQVTESKLADAQSKLEAQMSLTESVRSENQTRMAEVKQKEEEVLAIKSENSKLVRLNEVASRRIRSVEEKKLELERSRDKLRESIAAIDRELEAMRKAMDNDRKACEELAKERETLSKTLFKMSGQTAKQANLLRLHEQSKRNLEQEIVKYRQEAETQRQIICMLEMERDRYLQEASNFTQKVLNLMEEVKLREMQIFDFKKKIAEAQTKLKQQENLYEAVKDDRNLYSKNLIEAQDEISEMKRKLRIITHHIAQLKEEIINKDMLMVQESLECQRMTQERNNMHKELQRMKDMAIENRLTIEAQEAEERRLLKIIAEAEFERAKHRKELDQVISEKDILGIQLVKRNDELANLYDKIRIQKSVLDQAEAQYNKVLEDLRRVRADICSARREKAMLQASVSKIDDLKREVIRARKELGWEQTRLKALEDEAKKPINVHRWRKLEIYYLDDWRNYDFLPEGSDPSSFEMIKKIHMLQKRLMGKTEEVVEKEIQIETKERLYVELKQVLARQPGPEIAEQLVIYEKCLADKVLAMRVMTKQIETYNTNINDYKRQIENLNRELSDIRKNHFKKRGIEEMQKVSGLKVTKSGAAEESDKRHLSEKHSELDQNEIVQKQLPIDGE